jgi:hypothetical protein
LILTPEMTIAEAPEFDVTLVPGGYGQQELMNDEEVLTVIRNHFAAGRLLFSVCTGALLGIRDVVAGLVVLAMMLTAEWRLVGIALLVEAVIPLGDMSIILGSGGSRSRAFSIHGVTCAVMIIVGLLLIHAI